MDRNVVTIQVDAPDVTRYLTVRIHELHDLGESRMVQVTSKVLVVVVGHGKGPPSE